MAPWDPERRTGTGFVFERYDAQALLGALSAMRSAYDDVDGWRALMANGMAEDFSWARQGPRYVELYRNLIG